ncbi:hypothetical protein [Sphaerisporangium sp. TRM90804]|nr:hypothetical protein [Sphaerisporangium sp. TRM90804]MDH2429820.1 hypothetical protein [Sphaerisporangium sp. TRM90804]
MIVMLIALVVLALAAPFLGVDTRDGRDWTSTLPGIPGRGLSRGRPSRG